MRKSFTILLLGCLCATWLGYHLLFYIQLASIKSEMRSFLRSREDHKDVVVLHFNHKEISQLEWEDESEFRYGGEMYDVIEKKSNGQQISFRCIADKKETDLIKEHQKHSKQNQSDQQAVQLLTIQFILPPCFSLSKPGTVFHKKRVFFSSSLSTAFLVIPVPPPKLC